MDKPEAKAREQILLEKVEAGEIQLTHAEEMVYRQALSSRQQLQTLVQRRGALAEELKKCDHEIVRLQGRVQGVACVLLEQYNSRTSGGNDEGGAS